MQIKLLRSCLCSRSPMERNDLGPINAARAGRSTLASAVRTLELRLRV